MIEDGFKKQKIKGETRIPNGRYELKKRFHGRIFESYKIRFGHSWVVEVSDVPNFSDILIHIGNNKDDTSGCLLPCQSFLEKGGTIVGANSTTAYLRLMSFLKDAFEKGEVWLNVTRDLREILN